MADNPREGQIRALINGRFYPSKYEGKPELARAWAEKVVSAVHRVDPLRDLLANEDRAVELITRAIDDAPRHRDWSTPAGNDTRAVLAALRKVAGV